MTIPLPSKPKIVKKEKNKAVFEIEGFYPGYGATIANSLRRVLLSSLEGAAVTKMKIAGVHHEFSTIPGVLEDVISIMLNLKTLRFKLFGEESQKAKLSLSGEKTAKAADFNLPSQVEIINKDAHVATLTSKSAKLEIEIEIEKGLGYRQRELKKLGREKLKIGEISVDAIFTPVKRVGYRVENMRVGDRTDFDKIILEIETDGSVAPENAFSKACEILVNHFSFIAEGMKKDSSEEAPQKKEIGKKEKGAAEEKKAKPKENKKPASKKKK